MGVLSPPWCMCMFMYKEMWVYVSLCLSMMYGRVCTSHEYVWCVLSHPSRPGQDGKFPNRVCRELSRVRTPIKVSIYGSFFLGSEIVRLMFSLIFIQFFDIAYHTFTIRAQKGVVEKFLREILQVLSWRRDNGLRFKG